MVSSTTLQITLAIDSGAASFSDIVIESSEPWHRSVLTLSFYWPINLLPGLVVTAFHFPAARIYSVPFF